MDEYGNYLGRLDYYLLKGKYFMMVDNAYSDWYGYISGGAVGVDVFVLSYITYESFKLVD